MIRFFYNLLFPIGLALFLPGYLSKARKRGNYRHKLGQRFGLYAPAVRARLKRHRCTWIHAVSVGEVAIALKLATELRKQDAEFFCVLTTTTSTGFSFALTGAAPWMETMYNPLDFWPINRRAFAAIQPIRVVLIEAEVWPNLAAEARRRGIPLALVNARLSARSERRFRRFRFAVSPTFRCLDLICVQEKSDVERWAALGVDRARIQHVGSVKYDPAVRHTSSEPALEMLRLLRVDPAAPILFGGSTHRGEEEILGEIFLRLRTQFPNLFLIVAPRHAERAPEVRMTLENLGLLVARRTDLNVNASSPDVLLLDTTGELQSWYPVATIVFMGKSLAARGGQNPVEPILAGKPVLFGPHMENFTTLACALLARGGAIQVDNPLALEEKVAELLRDQGARTRLIVHAHEVLAEHRGATGRTAALLLALRSERSRPAGEAGRG